MKRMEPISRYGRISVRNAEVPARPAAITSGKSGRQHADAARTLPIAARLAATVPALLHDSDRVLATIPSLLMCSLQIPLAPSGMRSRFLARRHLLTYRSAQHLA